MIHKQSRNSIWQSYDSTLKRWTVKLRFVTNRSNNCTTIKVRCNNQSQLKLISQLQFRSNNNLLIW